MRTFIDIGRLLALAALVAAALALPASTAWAQG
jgi:hypothetical protein